MLKKNKTLRLLVAPVALALAAGTLGACSQDPGKPGTVDDSKIDDTLADALGSATGLDTFADAVSQTGLQSVFEGKASYTVLAPSDEAFDALGDKGAWLAEPDQRAILAAVLRDHIVPGHLTPDAIDKAIKDAGGSVRMRTLGEGMVTFAMEDKKLVMTGPDGEKADISGAAIATGNGVIIPVDGLLAKLPETS